MFTVGSSVYFTGDLTVFLENNAGLSPNGIVSYQYFVSVCDTHRLRYTPNSTWTWFCCDFDVH